MDPKDFDKILKEKLTGLSDSSSSMPDWDRMEKDLDSQKDLAFDEQVKRKLEQLSVSKYSRSNWSTLYELINTRILRKRAVLKYKALELSVLLIVLFSLSNMGWFDQYKKDVHYASSFETHNDLLSTNDEIIDHESNLALHSKSEIQSTKPLTQFESNQNNTLNINTALINEKYAQSAYLEQTSSVAIQHTDFLAKPIINLVSENTNQIDQTVKLDKEKMFFETEMLDNANRSFLALSSKNIEPILELPIIQTNQNKNTIRYFVAGGVDFAFTRIESALRNAPLRNAIPEDNTTNQLYPVLSLNAGVEFEKAAFSTGVEMQSISYNPAVSYISGQFSENITTTNIEELRYDVLSFPMNISWNLLKVKNWDFQVNTGLVTNLISNVNISANQNIRSGERITYVPEDGIDYSNIPAPLTAGILDEPSQEITSELSPFYFQTRTGIQVKRNLNSQTSILANFNYNYQLPLINQDGRDSFNSFTIGLSVRKYLG